MKKTLINLAMATSLIAGAVSAQAATNTAPTDGVDHTAQFVGLGVGAATGAMVAGPVGLVVGGIVGLFAGSQADPAAELTVDPAAESTARVEHGDAGIDRIAGTHTDAAIETGDDAASTDALVVASAASPESVLTDQARDHSTRLQQILTTDLSLDVYFRSGSTSVESFYAPRLQAIAALIREMPALELHLDGYSDRRGNPDDNLALSNQRLDAVRALLHQAGIDDSRIHSRAHGENRFLSSPGDLEAYTFDRRVVIRFESSVPSIANTEPAIPETPVASIDEIPVL